LTRRALVVGNAASIEPTLALFSHAGFMDMEVVGTVVDSLDHVDEQALALGATDILVALGRDVDEHLVQQLLRSREAGMRIESTADLYEETLHRVPVQHLGPSLVMTSFLSGVPAGDASPLAKRLLDLLVGSVLFVFGALLFPFIAAAIALESGFPIFYKQTRLGRAGHAFPLLKFRTMRHDAETSGAQWSSKDDPRATRVGRLLRRARLDELPNVLAVLRGDLSMVGPRPERPEFVEMLEQSVPLYRARLAATPGLTGWAQVNHEYGDSVEDAMTKLEYDLYYIKHQSLWLDLAILGRTVFTMLRLRGQ
jgi:lipopolysaccharide/colanic/teichoic acid biosynthesis glycosyltransferase